MSKTTRATPTAPVGEAVDSEVLAFRANFEARSPLDELVRTGAQRMLQAAIDAEVEDFIAQHADRRDEQGRRRVVRNGHLPSREILTGAGRLDVSQPRVRDTSPDNENRVRFSPSVLPPYLRRSKAIEELIPWLYLKGVSTGDFSEALQSLVGESAQGLGLLGLQQAFLLCEFARGLFQPVRCPPRLLLSLLQAIGVHRLALLRP